MNHISQAGQTFNTFYNLLKDLEKFIDKSEIKLAFDGQGNAYLMGPNFSEQLQAKPELTREVRDEMREIIAKHVPRIHPESSQ
jgi:hypothetical protein